MVNKNKNGDDDFETDDFADPDYDEENFDESGYIETADDEFADEDYEDNDWEEDEEEPVNRKPKKEKSLYTSGESKSGLSFNTIVIIGGVVLGAAVMGYNIMSKTAEQKESQKGVFKSMLDISGVMDGTLFSNEQQAAATDGQAEAPKDKAPEQQGFMDNPDSLTTVPPSDQQNAQPTVPNPNATTQPPQPAPTAPAETAEFPAVLTPLPGETASQTPRGPADLDSASSDDIPDVTAPATPQTPVVSPVATDTQAVGTADDVLKKAMENRQRAQNILPSDSPVDVVAAPTPATSQSVSSELVGMSDLPPVRNEGDKPVPFQKAATPQTDVPPPSADNVAGIGEAAAPANLETKIDLLLKRMDKIELEINTVKNSKGTDYASMQESLETLKKDVSSLQSGTGASSSPAKAKPKKPVAVSDEEAQPAPARPKKAAAKPKAAAASKPAVAATVSSRWELRAAQPGRAWISRKGERDMQTVEVGQSLPGVGTVTAITYQNNRWTVYGTQSQIQQ